MTYQLPSEYISNKEKRRNTHSVIKPDGSLVYVLKGTEITTEEFHRLFPLGDKIRHIRPVHMKGMDIDKTHI